MSAAWGVLAARARGLSTHLLTEERAHAVERAETMPELQVALRDTAYARFTGARAEGAGGLELAVTRSLAERMAVLARWGGHDGGVLRPIFLEQDARNLRDVVRGTLGGLAPEQRIAGAIPTPQLGRRELEALARAESVGSVAATLAQWGHPLGSALLDEARRRHPDAYRMEAALARRASAEVLRAARRSGRRMRAFLREGIDAGNAATALLLAGTGVEGPPADFFIEGGSALGIEPFERAVASASRPEAAALVADATAGTVLSTPLRGAPSAAGALAARILSARIEGLVRTGRVAPVSPAPVLLFLLRLRREARLVRRALWSAAMTGGRRP